MRMREAARRSELAITCGVLRAIGLLREARVHGNPERVREQMSGNLCRCGAYAGIVEAVLDAERQLAGNTERGAA